MNHSTWGIIGLGWLGQALADELKNNSITYWGTNSKNFNFITDHFPLTTCDYLFLNTPPLLTISPSDYVKKIHFQGKKIIFISSTSVFGQTNGTFSENDQPEPITASARWLYDVELLLKNNWQKNILIIRPGGLIGDKRHPIFYLAGKKNIEGAHSVVNLIHRRDLVQIIIEGAQEDYPLIHAVSPVHPNKKIYYEEWAKKLHLPTPLFNQIDFNNREIISVILKRFHDQWICPNLDFL